MHQSLKYPVQPRTLTKITPYKASYGGQPEAPVSEMDQNDLRVSCWDSSTLSRGGLSVLETLGTSQCPQNVNFTVLKNPWLMWFIGCRIREFPRFHCRFFSKFRRFWLFFGLSRSISSLWAPLSGSELGSPAIYALEWGIIVNSERKVGNDPAWTGL